MNVSLKQTGTQRHINDCGTDSLMSFWHVMFLIYFIHFVLHNIIMQFSPIIGEVNLKDNEFKAIWVL